MMTSPIYVIGHVNPDTDSIASAVGYAWLLRERDLIDTVAARAGAINPQTSWVIQYLKINPPILMTDASPRFESVIRRLDTTTPDRPLREAWGIASRTGGIAPIITKSGEPFGLITGRSLFTYLSKLVGPHHQHQDMKISEILDLSCEKAVEIKTPKFSSSTRIRDVINRILREEGDEFWVLDDNGKYLGICRQRDLLNPPRLKLILVDHNEPHQSLGSVEEAELLEILDHHRLGNSSTHIPIKFTVDVVGSTSTLVSERIEDAGFSAPPDIAGFLLAGLLSDTLILSSPTTTQRDRWAAERLARWSFISGTVLEGETIQKFGEKVLAAGSGIGARSTSEVVRSDLKIYSAGGMDFSISQAEVNDLYEVTEHLDSLHQAIDELKESKALDFSLLMITDVVRGSSKILITNPPAVLDDLPYPPLPDGTRMAEGLVSRKKQLLPAILGLLEA